MRAMALFAAALLVIVLVAGGLLAIPFATAGDRKAIATSAVVAVVVAAERSPSYRS